MEALFVKLLNISITASWMALAVIVLRLFLKKTPKFITVLMWALVGIRLLIPFSIESNFSLVPNAEPIIMEEGNEVELPDFDYVYTPPAAGSDNLIIIPPAGNTETDTPTLNPPQTQVQNTPAEEPAQEENNLWAVLAKIWLAGMGIMLIYAAASYLKVRSTVKEAMHLKDRVWVGDNVSTPFILGLVRPKIYLPSSLSDEDGEYVTAHETAHLKRGDHLWKPLGFLLLALYWYNPLMWVSYILLCRDIELAADEKVIKGLGEEYKKPYSHALINCSAHRKLISVCPLAFGEVAVKNRLKSVLNYKRPAFWVMIVTVLLCLAAALMFMTNPKDEAPSDGKENAEESSEELSESAENSDFEDYSQSVADSTSEEDSQSAPDSISEEDSQSVADSSSEEDNQSVVDSSSEEDNQSVADSDTEEDNDVSLESESEEDSESAFDSTSEEENGSNTESSSEPESETDSTSETESDSEADSTPPEGNDSEADSTPPEGNDSEADSTPEIEKPIVGESFVCIAHYDYNDNFWLEAENNLYISPYRRYDPIHKIESLEELNYFKTSYLKEGASFDHSIVRTVSLNKSTQGMDDAFFEDYDLYLCYFHGSDLYKAGDVLISVDGKSVTFTYEQAEKWSNLTKHYFLGVPVLKAYSKNFESFELAYRAKVSFYIPTADPDGFEIKEMSHPLSTAAIVDTLVAQGALPVGSKSIGCYMMDGIINLDMAAGFEELVCTQGSYTEYYGIGSLVNTLISYYGGGNETQPEGVIIKVDGRPMNTNLFGQLRDPLTFFEDREFEGNPPPPIQEKPVVGTWRFYHANFMDREELYKSALNPEHMSPLLKLDSVADVEQIKNKYQNKLNYHGFYNSVPNFSTELEYCDEAFFEDYSLFTLYVMGYEHSRYKITEVTISADGKGIDIGYAYESGGMSGNLVCWVLTVPVLKSACKDCELFTASYRSPQDEMVLDGVIFSNANNPEFTTEEETLTALRVMSSFLTAVHQGDSDTYNSLVHQDYKNRVRIYEIDQSFVDQTPIMFLPPGEYKNSFVLPVVQSYGCYFNQGAAPENDGMRHVLFSIYLNYSVDGVLGNEYVFDLVFEEDGNCTVYNFGEENIH